MTATEEVRRMLDERGVEWMPIAWNPKRETYYHTSNGVGFCADEYADGVKIYTDATITPEQAIEATLGRGTCHITVQDNMTETEGMGDVWLECDACGWQMPLEPSTPRFNYCPNCGRRVEQ